MLRYISGERTGAPRNMVQSFVAFGKSRSRRRHDQHVEKQFRFGEAVSRDGTTRLGNIATTGRLSSIQVFVISKQFDSMALLSKLLSLCSY